MTLSFVIKPMQRDQTELSRSELHGEFPCLVKPLSGLTRGSEAEIAFFGMPYADIAEFILVCHAGKHNNISDSDGDWESGSI